ncbi:hypothetical protein M409DRAFT_54110 [Zasmidium cellare ATCC 36951]|uniref:Uncharacterized protein n=1 Tax=Zasmidium cellare ATCC 36951 TaxID=1080233 RepID=A0A6A6CKE5_ZASCE|nr:uncharacterized protein M409DRAFT_54110 [Zasmidium cellare ATCC 36951]KAF2167511.1 hypothetical protein M409DRAFT_54110 [Zasmidium cellare ATCC 36951]
MDTEQYIDATLNATDKWLERHQEELERKLAWVRAIRQTRWEQATRPAALTAIPSLPQEIKDSMFDVLAEGYGPIKITGDTVDDVVKVANQLVGPSAQAQSFRGDMQDALMRTCALVVSPAQLLRVLETQDRAPILRSRLQKARRVVMQVSLQASSAVSHAGFATQQQRRALWEAVNAIQLMTEIRRESSPQLKSLRVQISIATLGDNPQIGLEDTNTKPLQAFDYSRLPDGSDLRYVLEYIIKVMQTIVSEGSVERTLQLRARRYWSGSSYSSWDGKEIAVKGKIVDGILQEANPTYRAISAASHQPLPRRSNVILRNPLAHLRAEEEAHLPQPHAILNLDKRRTLQDSATHTKMSGLNIGQCLDATPEQLQQRIDEMRREIEWIEKLREQKSLADVVDQLAGIPEELTEMVLDLAAERHGPIKYRGEVDDLVAIAARGILGGSDPVRKLAPIMEEALLKKATIIVNSTDAALVTSPDPHRPVPQLCRYLKRVRHLVIPIAMQDTAPTQFMQSQQHATFRATIQLIKDLTDTRRENAFCPHLESICIQPSVAAAGNDPRNAFQGLETAFNAAQAPNGSELRPILQHIIHELQGVSVDRMFQVAVRCFWAGSSYSTWAGECLKVKSQSVDDILREAQDSQRWEQVG